MCVLFVLFTLNTYALVDPGDPGEPCDSPDPITGDCQLPLDNWVYVLVFAAVIYGVYKLHQKQKALTV